MSLRTKLLLILSALLLTASLALAAPPAAAPQTPAVAAAQPPAALSPAAPACNGTDLPIFSPAPRTTASDACGSCSDAACVGLPIKVPCGSGGRCISSGSACSSGAPHCRCLII
jgi:ABC-type transport system substrate-binding protein